MTDNELIEPKDKDMSKSVGVFEEGLKGYLSVLGLPRENVLVSTSERGKVINNLPEVINIIDKDKRVSSLYLSKFVAAVAAGLFDAALNFIWDETIKSLREKVVLLDIEYFYSSTIKDPERLRKYKNQDDLRNLDDWELIKGCLHTGILSDLGYKHLDYIRNMRNWASAAHPNQSELTGLQLVSWLETCIKEVIAKEPSSSAIEIKRLLQNLRTQELKSEDIPLIEQHLSLLSGDLSVSFLLTIFGMYTDPKIAVPVRNNIKLIAVNVWSAVDDDVKYDIGIKYRTFAANAEIQKRDYAREFIEFVDGLSFLPSETLQIEFGQAIQNLYDAHIGFNNFHNEPAHARLLERYVPENGEIPTELRFNYVKTVVMCAIGNGYGVSSMGESCYSDMINKFQAREVGNFCKLLMDKEFASRLQFPDCKKRFRSIADKLQKITTHTRLLPMFNLLEKTSDEVLQKVGLTTAYKDLFK